MSKKYIFVIGFLVIINLAFAEKGNDHFGHKHDKTSQHSDDDGHDHSNKKGHDDHSGHNHSKDSHSEHKGHKHGSEDDHGHGNGKALGKGKAIEVVDEVKGFKLSKEAIKSLELKLKTVDGDEFEIEKPTLVTSKNIKGLYRFRGGYFKFLEVKLVKEIKGKYLVKVKGVDFGDQIVTNGVGLLRVTDVYSTDKSEYGHSH
ncbi:MAG: hypothetical protein N4A33_02860 [Bacteriovoracaceae bacterium]|jgi:hypothetical protein|nr:hypothetical protein [Bacteriovoracaceae bacterium]